MKSFGLILIAAHIALAQTDPEMRGIHWMESIAHRGDTTEQSSGPAPAFVPLLHKTAHLSRKVFGYHPYWADTAAYRSYDYSVLSTIGYFSYDVDTATGSYTTINKFTNTPLIAYAHARGVKVVLVVTNFGSAPNTAILKDTVKQNTMILTLISLLQQAGGDGVNIDFESVPSSQKANLVSFMRKLSTRVKAVDADAEISMAAPAVDWSGSWDLAQLGSICDYLFIMGYDYYWSGSNPAGPVAPLAGENYNVTRSVNTYLSAGVPASKIYLGVPWYGYDWPVTSNARKAATTGTGKSQLYYNAISMAKTYGRTFDATTQVPYFSYQSNGSWRQVWYDDSTSLALKCALVNQKNLGGYGMWALSYQGTGQELWSAMKSIFTSVRQESPLPRSFALLQSYPNPFNPSTTIRFAIPAQSETRLSIYDALGRLVDVLVAERLEAGTYRATWNAAGRASGVYICRLVANDVISSVKLVLIK